MTSRPRISTSRSSERRSTVPADIFISSAVRGPMTSFFLRRTY